MAFPDLQIYPNSGLSFPWTVFYGRGGGSGGGAGESAAMGGDGGAQENLTIAVRFSDLSTAVQELVGWSERLNLGYTVTAASPATPIQITTSAPHSLATGQYVTITGVAGNTAANGVWKVTSTGPTTFTLDGSVANAAYTSGGRVNYSRISRSLPWKCPQFPGLWCDRITRFRGLQPKGSDDDGTGPFSSYEFALLDLTFGRPPYPVLADTQVTDAAGFSQEWLRYTDRLWTPSIQMISREGGTFKFTEGAANNPLGKTFPGRVGQKLCKVKLTRRWYGLPEACVYDESGFPTNLITGSRTGGTGAKGVCGGVNQGVFFGRAEGTLLYETPEIIPRPLPIPANLMDILPIDQELYFQQYDVIFHMEFFDPQLGPSATSRGHNCFPYYGDGLWYIAKDSVTQTQTAFPYYDFYKLFVPL